MMADLKGQRIGVPVSRGAARFGVPGRTTAEVARSPTRKITTIDPKDKLAYFKDNVQDDGEEDFDPNVYYYHRDKEAAEFLNSAHLNPVFPGQGPFSMHHGLMGSSGPTQLGTSIGSIASGLGGDPPQPQPQPQAQPQPPLVSRILTSSDSGRSIPSAVPRTNGVLPVVGNGLMGGSNLVTGLQPPISSMSRQIAPPTPSGPVPPHIAAFNSVMTSKLPAKSTSMSSTSLPGFSESSGPAEPSSFDMSEFPVLGARPSSNKTEFNLGGEDFPALPGFKDSDGSGAGKDLSQDNLLPSYQTLGGAFPTKMAPSPMSHAGTGYISATPNLRTSSHGLYSTPSMGLATSYDGLIPPPGLAQPPPTSPSSRVLMSPTHQTAKSAIPLNISGTQQPTIPNIVPITPPSGAGGLAGVQQQQQQSSMNQTLTPDRFGLLGLLSVIRMTEPDLNTLALGTDLTTLGLNLNSPDCLYATFASPFADSPSRREPEFYLPLCYYTQPPMQPPTMKMAMFSEETLFYIFYSMPRDTLQMHAAAELYNHDWRYHKEHKLWFTRVHGTEPIVKTSSYERGSYFYFDPNTWEKMRKDNFVLCYDQLETVSKSS